MNGLRLVFGPVSSARMARRLAEAWTTGVAISESDLFMSTATKPEGFYISSGLGTQSEHHSKPPLPRCASCGPRQRCYLDRSTRAFQPDPGAGAGWYRVW